MKDLEKVFKVSDDCALTILELQELYNNRKSVVWVIRIRHMGQEDVLETHGTAFSVSSDGLILTSAHLFPKTSYELDVRRLDEANFHQAKIVLEKPKWDVILLQVLDVNGCQYATFTNDGSLSVGQSLLHIGNPDQFVGSFLMGKVAFECIDHVEVPITGATCKTYTPTALSTTPRHRIMGHVWNEDVFTHSSFCRSSYAKNLHPLVPIIQIYGLTCGEGCSGGPVFNVKGEVVGMLAMSSGGYEIAIHVAALREILRLFKEQHPDDEDGKRKDISDPKVQGRDSKKFKALPADRKGKGGHYSVVDTV